MSTTEIQGNSSSPVSDEIKHWDALCNDMLAAINKVFYPLKIEGYNDEEFIAYEPPFYLEDKCNEVSFGVTVICDDGEIPQYPIRCTSDWNNRHCRFQAFIPSGEEFIVQSAEDWDNHMDKIVAWKDDCMALIAKIRNA